MRRFEHEGVTDQARRLPGADFAALRCYGGGGGSSPTSSASGQGSTTGASSPQTIGASSPINTGGAQIATSGNVTFTNTQSTDPLAFSTIAAIVGNSLNNTAQTQQAIQAGNNSNNDALNSILGQVVSADQAIAAGTASGGATTTTSSIVKITLLAMAGFFGWLLLRPKHS